MPPALTLALPPEQSPMPTAAPIAIQISGLQFEVTVPYVAGHQVSEAEAAVLNQAWLDNIRTNFAKRVQQAGELTDDARAVLASEFEAYVASYSFKSSGPRPLADPVQREAQKIARVKVLEHLNSKGLSAGAVPESQFTAMVERLAQNPSIQTEARRRIEALTAVSEDIFDLGLV